jgi:hypothetical protein
MPMVVHRSIKPVDDDYNKSDESDYDEMNPKKKREYDNQAAERERDAEMRDMHRLDLPIPSFWDAIKRIGHYERDNTMHNMLFRNFYVLGRSNAMFYRLHQGARITQDTRDTPDNDGGQSTKLWLYKVAQQGMPLTAWEVKQLLKLLHNEYGQYVQ